MKIAIPNLFSRKNVHFLIIYVFLLVSLTACKKETPVKVVDLKIPLTTYYIPEGSEISIGINSGNNRYTLSNEDEGIMLANYSGTYSESGSIRIQGLKKGSTVLTVKDDMNGQEVRLDIHVVDPFLVVRAGNVVGNVTGVDSETGSAIRSKLCELAAFEAGEILLLHRNTDFQYFVFKHEEDLKNGIVNRSGHYALNFSYGGPNRLILHDTETDDAMELIIQAQAGTAFSTLLEFSREKQGSSAQMAASDQRKPSSGLIAENTQNTSPTITVDFIVYNDLTEAFREDYSDIESVESFQAMLLLPFYQHLAIGEGILK